MAVNSTHAEYDANLPAWLRARDVLAGEDAVKGGGEKYLPRLDNQTDEEYAAYRARAAFFNATARTADGYLGLVFRRPPFVKVPDQAEVGGRRSEDGNGHLTPALSPERRGSDEAASGNGTPSPWPSPPRGRGNSALGRAMEAFVVKNKICSPRWPLCRLTAFLAWWVSCFASWLLSHSGSSRVCSSAWSPGLRANAFRELCYCWALPFLARCGLSTTRSC